MYMFDDTPQEGDIQWDTDYSLQDLEGIERDRTRFERNKRRVENLSQDNLEDFGLNNLFDEGVSLGERRYDPFSSGTVTRLPQGNRFPVSSTRSTTTPGMASAAAGALGSMGSATISGMFGLINQSAANAAQRERQEEQNKWQSGENNAQRTFIGDQAGLKRTFLGDQAQKNYLFQKEFEKQKADEIMSLYNTQFNDQKNLFDYRLGQQQAALRSAGLPEYLAQMPEMMQYMPRQAQLIQGGRRVVSALPGNPRSTAYNSSPLQSALGWGAR